MHDRTQSWSGLSRWIQPVLLLLAVVLMAPSIRAQEAKSYAYFYLQGRLSDPAHNRPLGGAEIRLTGEGQTFQTTTDPKGNFIFQKLPMATYDLHVTTADGRVIHGIEEINLKTSGPRQYRAKLSRGEAATPVIEAAEKGVSITIPKPPVKWKRFWKQFAIFAGGALVLAL